MFAENLGYYVYSDEDGGWKKSDDRWDSAAGDDEVRLWLPVARRPVLPTDANNTRPIPDC